MSRLAVRVILILVAVFPFDCFLFSGALFFSEMVQCRSGLAAAVSRGAGGVAVISSSLGCFWFARRLPKSFVSVWTTSSHAESEHFVEEGQGGGLFGDSWWKAEESLSLPPGSALRLQAHPRHVPIFIIRCLVAARRLRQSDGPALLVVFWSRVCGGGSHSMVELKYILLTLRFLQLFVVLCSLIALRLLMVRAVESLGESGLFTLSNLTERQGERGPGGFGTVGLST